MKLIIRGSPTDKWLPSAYRGTKRFFPCYVNKVDVSHSANQAYFLYLQSRNKDDFLHDIAIAREVVKAYETLIPKEFYEIIEVTEGKASPESPENVFLGYELSDSYYSLITALIAQNRESDDRPWEIGVPKFAVLFDRLIVDYFKPKLNKYLLFDSYDDAEYCLECMMAILELAPQFYESGEYKVVGIYKII